MRGEQGGRVAAEAAATNHPGGADKAQVPRNCIPVRSAQLSGPARLGSTVVPFPNLDVLCSDGRATPWIGDVGVEVTCQSTGVRSRQLGSIALFLFCLVACGCNRTDPDATVADADLVLAVDGFHRLAIEDACRGGGKGNFCSTEQVVSLEAVTSSDTGVVDVLRHDQLPKSLSNASADFALHALRPGQTKLAIDARFDDGSVRRTEVTVFVAAPNALEVAIGCGHPDVTDRELLPVGAKSRLSVKLLRDQQELGGFALGALQGGSLAPLAGSLERTEYTLTAPDAAGAVKLGSALLSDFGLSLRVFDADELEIAALDSRLPKPLRFASGIPVGLTADLRVAGRAPCFVMSLQASSRSTDICLGPNRETVWSEPTPGSMRILPLASGRCELTVSVLSSNETKDFSVDFEVTPP